MASKVFLDANVVLDFLLQRNGYEHIEPIVENAIKGTIKLYLSSSIIHITTYWLKKEMSVENVKHILITFLSDINCVDMDHNMVMQALHSDFKDVEDALQYYTALHHKVDCVLSRDKKFIKSAKSQLPVYDPATFIKKFMN
ncbi:MAG TPA: PIN domain-containing protein [Parafilimonas sp.]|nr:PIN domain-containing protein [Parafilimonas sp.]